MSMLFNGDNSDSDGELKINAEYESIYNNFRRKEELHKLKARYGEDVEALDNESSDSSSSEDDDENVQNPQFEKEFLITLACLKNNDPRIYDKNVKFFSDTSKIETSKDDELKDEGKKKLKKEKALSLREYERKIIMERDGRFSSSEDDDDTKNNIKMPTYVEEQKQLKDSFKHALKEDEDEDTDLLKIKQETKDEKHKEEDSYKKWLKGQEVEINTKDKEELEPLRNFWKDPNLDANEKFLRDYILYNKYEGNESHDVDLEYNQIVHDDSDENLSEGERTIQKQDEFERKYNFRFEEPDEEFIKRYPRTMENSMRKKDTRRVQKRMEVRQRKEEEKQRKREELKQLKALKRKEIEEKIEKLKEITGNNDMRFDSIDLEGDFNPIEYDKKMKELFNDEYYTGNEDENKPEFPDIDEELEIEPTWDKYDPTTDEIDNETESYKEPHCEDPNFNMDADYDESRNVQSELIENTKKRKRRKRSKFAELIAKTKPKFDPKQYPSYEDYFNEYYSLDYEDMIGDLPCRFKYRKVVPNDYGLSVEEILTADDKELNKWCSLIKALKYKPEHVEQNEVRIYQQKAADEANKRKVLKSLYTEPEEKEENKSVVEQIGAGTKKRKRKNKANNPNVESINTDAVSKKEIMEDIGKNSMQDNSHNSKNDEKQDKDVQEKDVHKNKKKKKNSKRKNSEVDSNAVVLKKMKTDESEKKDSCIKTDNINIKVEKNNKKMAFTSAAQKKNKNKNSRLNKMKTEKCKPNNDDSIMSLGAERLKTYGINAKKFKNKLKYGKRKF